MKKDKERDKNRLRINREIVAVEVRVIGPEGQMEGVMHPRDALQKAESYGLDLIEIAPNSQPPTCRIMDYGKWKYEAQKKEKVAKKKQTIIVIKEIQLRPRTDEHDLNVKLKQAKKFLLNGDKVKVNLRFYGREMAHQELGIKVLEEVSRRLSDVAMVETSPKREGRQVFVLLVPDSKKVKEYKDSLPKNSKADDGEAEDDNEAVKSEE